VIACICKRVRPERIAQVIEDGASSIAEVGRNCGAGTGCGNCHAYIKKKIDEAYETSDGDGVNFLNFLPVRAATG